LDSEGEEDSRLVVDVGVGQVVGKEGSMGGSEAEGVRIEHAASPTCPSDDDVIDISDDG